MSLRFRSLSSLAAILLLTLLRAPICQAQPPGPPPGGGFGGPGGPGGPFGGGIVGLAMREEVQKELQIVDEQKEKVRALTEEMRNTVGNEMRGMFEQLRDLSNEERRTKFDEIRAKMESINADYEKKLGEVLLPHQLERLKQIDLQSKIRRNGASALTNGDVAQALNLTEEQREKLEKRAAEVQEEMQAKMRELQAEARQKIIDVLTPEQQATLKKLMGDQFDMPEPNFGGFQRRFGQGGGNRRPRPADQ